MTPGSQNQHISKQTASTTFSYCAVTSSIVSFHDMEEKKENKQGKGKLLANWKCDPAVESSTWNTFGIRALFHFSAAQFLV